MIQGSLPLSDSTICHRCSRMGSCSSHGHEKESITSRQLPRICTKSIQLNTKLSAPSSVYCAKILEEGACGYLMAERCDTSGEAGPADGTQKKDEDLQQRAEHLYDKGKLGECLMVLEAASAQRKEHDPRQKLIVQMHVAARNREWKKVGSQIGRHKSLLPEVSVHKAKEILLPGPAAGRCFG